MTSQTIETELEVYKIGEKVRALRKERGLRLIELGNHTGLSAAMLSKIEGGKIVPTLPTLTRIALAFSVGLEHFFAAEGARHAFGITRSAQRVRLPGGTPKGGMPYDFESLDYTVHEPKLNAYLASFRSSAPNSSHKHDGVEFIFIVEGSLELTWAGRTHVLEAGDSVYFDPRLDHSYRRRGDKHCTGVVVTLRS
ncbi:MAG: helix-turn-helix transcriptional regulator [Planctomycetes bacterium]|nr:helix-turn-helix transcriptional regulator [Planctomycetota bacterium]